MVVVASSAITVIEDFSKDTLGRYGLNYIIGMSIKCTEDTIFLLNL